jgi:hypothetical protein
MKFLIERIDSTLSAWSPKLKTPEQKYSIVFVMTPTSNFSMDIDDHYVLCSDVYYETHSAELMNRKRICCSATIVGSDTLNHGTTAASGLGFGRLIDEDLNFFIQLNSQIFLHLCHQINSMKFINDLFITFSPHLEDGSCKPSFSENPNKLVWDRSHMKNDSRLEIKSFEFGCNLFEVQD